MSENRKIRALVFDDDKGLRTFLSRVLERRGYEVIAFEDPSHCSLHVDEKCACSHDELCADLIISDIKMLQVDGLTFIKSLLGKGCKISPANILIISGFVTDAILKETKEIGIETFQKPFTFDKINVWLNEREKNVDLGIGLAKL